MDIPEILGGESRYIEYKSTRPEKSKVYIKTVVSFCNGIGGKLVFGIEDKTHKVIGIREEILFKEIDAIANAISDLCESMIVSDIYADNHMKLMEKWGSGIPRVLKEVCDEGLDSPVFEGGEVDFIVNIYRKEILADIDMIETDETKVATNETETETKLMVDTNEFTTDERSVIDVVRDNPTITQQGLLEITGISMGTIKRIMPRLQKKGVLIREGNRRVGQWKVIE